MELILKLSGILLGVLARTLVPYLRKLKQGKITEFQNKYWISALASLGLGVITTILIFPKFEITQVGQCTEALVRLFCLAFAFGYACNSIVSEGIKWTERRKVK